MLGENGYASVAELAHAKFEDVNPPVTGAAAALLRGLLTQEARANEAVNQAVNAREWLSACGLCAPGG